MCGVLGCGCALPSSSDLLLLPPLLPPPSSKLTHTHSLLTTRNLLTHTHTTYQHNAQLTDTHTHNLLTHTHNLPTHTHNLLTHNLLTHEFTTHIQLTHPQLTHSQLTHWGEKLKLYSRYKCHVSCCLSSEQAIEKHAFNQGTSQTTRMLAVRGTLFKFPLKRAPNRVWRTFKMSWVSFSSRAFGVKQLSFDFAASV